MSGLKIFMLGGSGFVGRAIATRLVRENHDLRILSRRRERHRDLLVYPQITLVDGDVHDMGLLRTLFQGVDVVINLVGILNEGGRDGRGFRHAHVELAGKVAEACHQTKVRRLLHMSALNAGPGSPSHYLRSKAEAESLLHREQARGLLVTSFRPSVIFGPGDSFLNRFAGLLKTIPVAFPLACARARFQPVYVGDVASAFAAAIGDHHSFGQRYDLCGPRVYTLRQLVEYTARLIGVKRRIIELSPWQSWLQAAAMEWVPGKPFSIDNYRSLQVDSVCDGEHPPRVATVTALEDVAPGYLHADMDHYALWRRQAGRN